MTVPYLARLACLSLAAYFLLHTVFAAAVCAVSRRAVRAAEALRPRDGARLLLALRLLPAMLALLAVAAILVPSFLWLEPTETPEAAGAACLLAASLGAFLCLGGLARGLRAAFESRRYTRLFDRLARTERIAGFPVRVVDARAPLLALAGVAPPRVVISRGIIDALAPEQLAAALAHEEAHRRSHDNLTRLALLIAPRLVPGVRAFSVLERSWARLAEWAADEAAVANDPDRRLALADALIRTVRLGCAAVPACSLATSLLADPADLQARVARLLHAPAGRRSGSHCWVAAGFAVAALALIAAQPATLYSVHELLEGLMR